MKPWTDWQMQVSVISTAHMPSPDPDFGKEYVWAPVNYEAHVTFMVLIEDLDENAPEWLIKLNEGMRNKGFAPAWVRFDCNAHIIEGLPTFKWD
jgi:hypothetical protein